MINLILSCWRLDHGPEELLLGMKLNKSVHVLPGTALQRHGWPSASMRSPLSVERILSERHSGKRVSDSFAGLAGTAVGLVEAWVGQHVGRQADSSAPASVPRWIDALLLILDACVHAQPSASPTLLVSCCSFLITVWQ